jgi:hypothetical protein
MIAYKWVIKKDNKYFSLRNFGIDGGKRRSVNHTPYEKNNSYETNCLIKSEYFKLRNAPNSLTSCQGFHFWKTPTNICLENWNKFLEKEKQPQINAILKCEINNKDIFIENDYQLVTKKFIVLEEIKI